MNSTAVCLPSYDDSFGPQVNVCRNGFDFTLYFEQSILSIGPSAFLLLFFPFRVFQLYRGNTKTKESPLRLVKLATIGILGCVQLGVLILWSSPSALRTRASIPASALGVINCLALATLSNAEQKRAIRPSTLITIYLLFSTLLDVAQVRTLWLREGHDVIAAVFTANVAFKVLLLLMEVREKRNVLVPKYKHYPPEATSGILNRSFFLWLNRLFSRGFSRSLKMDDLYSIDKNLLSKSLHYRLISKWGSGKQANRYRLLFALASSLKTQLLYAIFPRMALMGFTYSQPFLINRIISFLSEPEDPNSKRIGITLIGATALIYVGIAISTGLYKHQTYRMITMARGSLVSLIFNKTLTIDSNVIDDSAAVTLMSTDVESIALGLEDVQEVWANMIEVGLALWLLERQIGIACVAPAVTATCCTVLSLRLAKYMPNKKMVWNRAIQKRVALTASMVGSVKGVKMMGWTKSLTEKIQGLRVTELERSKSYRMMVVWINVVANIPSQWTPVIAFLIFTLLSSAGSGSAPSPAQAFTSLSIMTLLTEPLTSILAVIPAFAGTLGSFDRIQMFLLSKSRQDDRLYDSVSRPDYVNANPTLNLENNAIELQQLTKQNSVGVDERRLGSDSTSILIQNGNFGAVGRRHPILKEINLRINKGLLTTIVGTIGSGKTTLLKSMLGEVLKNSGSVYTSSYDIAYCAQEPWLTNTSVKQNILAGSEFELKWYQTVVHACALDEDLTQFSVGDDTTVGSKGVTLSGGQKQRLALARAVYSRKKVIFLDDILSGLDAITEDKVFSRLLGKYGLFRKYETTVVLVTHAVHHLQDADHIIVLGDKGFILEQGTFAHLNSSSGYVSSLLLSRRSKEDLEVQASNELQSNLPSKLESPADGDARDLTRRTGDLSVYKYYIQSIGIYYILTFIMFETITEFSISFSQIWLRWWTESSDSNYGGETTRFLGVYAFLVTMTTVANAIDIWLMFVVIVPKSAQQLHLILLEAFMNAPYSFSVANDTGATTNRFSQDMSLIDQTLPTAALITTTSLAGCIGGLILMSTGASYMAATILPCMVVIYVIQKVYLRTSRQLRFMDLEAKAPLYTSFLETLTGLTTIRAFKWEGYFEERNFQFLDASQRPYYLLFCAQRWLNLVLDLLVAGLAVLLVTFAVTIRSSTSAGAIGVALVNVLNFNQYLSLLITWWTQLETSIGAIARVKNFAETTPSEIRDWEICEAPENWPTDGAIEIKDVTLSYSVDSQSVLHGLSLSFKQKEKIGICGRTGSGKSSLVLAFFRLLEVNSGSIVLDGVDLATLRRETIRSHLTVIPQEPYIFSGAAISVLQKVGLWELLDERGGLDADFDVVPLSQGQQQLFSMARAMLRKSMVLLLDEATSSVDKQTDQLMQRLIREEFKGRTIIAVAHRLSTIIDFDKIVVLEKGRLAEFGSPSELLARDSIFRAMYNSQN